MIKSLKALTLETLDADVESLFISFRSHKLDEIKIRSILIRFFFILFQTVREKKIKMQKRFLDGFDPHEAVEALSTLDEWFNLMDNIVKSFIEAVEVLQNLSTTKITRDAVNYIEKHYTEKISLSAVAKLLKITPNYLSKIFKEDTGENFIPYMNRFRIKIAADMLTESDKMIYEITSETGFRDSKYFTTQFRKFKGVCPREFRNRGM